MNLEELTAKLPLVKKWIEDTLTSHAPQARTVASYRFARLPQFYPEALLTTAKVVVVDRVPVPPLTDIGLPEFAEFVNGDYAGITYKDTYFLRTEAVMNESTHFHELVHVVQWQHLGVEGFLMAYGQGLAQFGYIDSPLEQMAYGLQHYFDTGGQPGNMEAFVQGKLRETYGR
jgi:hypothetical protein